MLDEFNDAGNTHAINLKNLTTRLIRYGATLFLHYGLTGFAQFSF